MPLTLNIPPEDISHEDLTAATLAEEKLRQSEREYLVLIAEERYQLLFEHSPDGVVIIDPATARILEFNETAHRQLGYSREEFARLSVYDIDVSQNPDEIRAHIATVVRLGKSDFETLHRTRQGEILNIHVTAQHTEMLGLPVYHCIWRDITARKQAEHALRDSEAKYRSLASTVDRLVLVDRNCIILFANEAFWERFGNSPDPVIGRSFAELHSGAGFKKFVKGVNYVFATGHPYQDEWHGIRTGRYWLRSFSPVRNSEGDIYAASVAYKNITDRKHAEEELRESEAKYRALASTVDSLLLVDKDCRYLFANDNYQHLIGLPWDQFINKKYDELHDAEATQLFTEAVAYVYETGKHYQKERWGNKSKRWWLRTFSPVKNAEGAVTSVTVAYKDITSRHETEEHVRASLREKEILLREVHHRVKNNMQVISSLLNLQAASIKDRDMVEIFQKIQKRIRSMALIHEKLYRADDLTRINMADYTHDLARELIGSYAFDPAKITLVIEAKDVYTDLNKAIPCGLILNELITNALKHAFPADCPGELRIIIRATENQETRIAVRDNGVGLPAAVDPGYEGIGLYLVNGLVTNQLGGRMEIVRDQGTEFRITFPV